jgi:very-short-patch-repair endonuclease
MRTFIGLVAEVQLHLGEAKGLAASDWMNEERVSQQAREGLIERARQMRKEPTNAEALLWARLRKRQLDGLKFRRQQIIQYFIVDFYCPSVKLVIEIDGPVHDVQEEYDQEREKILQELGYQVVRFKNSEVESNIDLLVASISDYCRRRIDLLDDITNDKAV